MEASHQPEHGAEHRLSPVGTREPFRRFTRDRTAEIEAGLDQAADWGLFGPESTTWKIHTHPVLIVGGFRALMVQALHPLAMAGVAMYSDYKSDPLSRFRRTAQYVHQVVFSDTETARSAAAHVRRVHDKINGIDPVTGQHFSANDPETLLWVHCAQAYSAIVARRELVGDLTEAEQDRYLAEFVVAGELIGIPREIIPASRAEYREYFASMRPSLCASQASHDVISFVSKPHLRDVAVKEWPFAVNLKWAGHAAATLMPRSLRQIAGMPKTSASEWAIRRWTSLNAKAISRALGNEAVAGRFDNYAARKMGTDVVPRLHEK